MIAIKLTKEFFDIALVLDPSLAELEAEHLVDSHLVIDKKNKVRTIVKSERFEDYYELVDATAIPILKVRKKKI